MVKILLKYNKKGEIKYEYASNFKTSTKYAKRNYQCTKRNKRNGISQEKWLVTVIVKGTRNIKSIKIEEDEDIKEDLSILEDMLTIAINDAFKQIDDITNKKLGKYANMMPGLM